MPKNKGTYHAKRYDKIANACLLVIFATLHYLIRFDYLITSVCCICLFAIIALFTCSLKLQIQ